LSIAPADIPDSDGPHPDVDAGAGVFGPTIDPQKLLKYDVFGGFRLSFVVPANSWQGGDYFVPLVDGEIPFDAEQIKSFDEPPNSLSQKIKSAMTQTTEFKVLFERCFPFSDIFAARTIYIMEAFIPSLTDRSAAEGSAKDAVKYFVKVNTEFDLWNGRMFETSRKYLKSTIQQYYYGRSASYVEDTFKELTPSAKASNLVTKSIVSESVRELGLSMKEMEKMFTVPVGFKLPSKE